MKRNSTAKFKFYFIVLFSCLSCWSLSSQAILLEAESYNEAFDKSPGNVGGAFRGGDVDIQATTDAGGGFNVGWIEATEWLKFTNINFPTTGQYKIELRVASLTGGSASVDLNSGSIQLGTVSIPATGDWQNWTSVFLTVNVNAGNFDVGVFAHTNGWNLNWVKIFPVPTSSSSALSSIKSSIASSSGSSISINVDRSLFVHDTATLQAADFSLRSTLQQLVNQLNASNPNNTTTPEQLFARMWDTQNPTPGVVVGGDKCTGSLNGFAVECRPTEGAQANNPAAAINNYIPISLVNRFDLRNTVSFNDCGEHRVIYANQSGGRNFIIFEAQLPNPTPGVAAGCLPVAQFWQNLSTENNATLRATALRNFYFGGIPSSNVRAVIDIRNYAVATGQVRTNMFMGNSWSLKEFKVGINPQGLSMIAPVSVKSNPVAFLFDGNNTDPRAPQFQADFVANLGSLLTGINTFSLTVANNAHNNGQSHANGPTDENDFNSAFSNTNANAFQIAVTNKLNSFRSPLTSTQLMNRATAMTCGGCHQPGTFGLTFGDAIGPGQTWPDTLGFTHVSEFANAGVFPISPALTGTFLPARLAGLKNFLSSQGSAAPLAAPGALLRTSNTVETSPTDAPAPVTPEQPFNKRAG